MTMLEYWRWHYSDIYDLQDTIAEYIVGKALGLTEAQNVGSWTLFDMKYREKRIEVKETSYYHSWQGEDDKISLVRNFGISKAHDSYQDSASPLNRQNDIYVFCLNIGKTREESNPMKLEKWEFYIVPTAVINQKCGNQKSISLKRIKALGYTPVDYLHLRHEIDRIIDKQ